MCWAPYLHGCGLRPPSISLVSWCCHGKLYLFLIVIPNWFLLLWIFIMKTKVLDEQKWIIWTELCTIVQGHWTGWSLWFQGVHSELSVQKTKRKTTPPTQVMLCKKILEENNTWFMTKFLCECCSNKHFSLPGCSHGAQINPARTMSHLVFLLLSWCCGFL